MFPKLSTRGSKPTEKFTEATNNSTAIAVNCKKEKLSRGAKDSKGKPLEIEEPYWHISSSYELVQIVWHQGIQIKQQTTLQLEHAGQKLRIPHYPEKQRAGRSSQSSLPSRNQRKRILT